MIILAFRLGLHQRYQNPSTIVGVGGACRWGSSCGVNEAPYVPDSQLLCGSHLLQPPPASCQPRPAYLLHLCFCCLVRSTIQHPTPLCRETKKCDWSQEQRVRLYLIWDAWNANSTFDETCLSTFKLSKDNEDWCPVERSTIQYRHILCYRSPNREKKELSVTSKAMCLTEDRTVYLQNLEEKSTIVSFNWKLEFVFSVQRVSDYIHYRVTLNF